VSELARTALEQYVATGRWTAVDSLPGGLRWILVDWSPV